MAVRPIGPWRDLATISAGILGSSSPDTIAGILAQWSCEQSGPWPPTRNNPGNVAKGWADGVGIPYRIERPNPQPSNPIVTYSSPELGARSYALGLAKFDRYRKAVSYARAGNGAAFTAAVCDAGYGTSKRCTLSVYKSLGGINTAPSSGSGGGGGGAGPSSGGGGGGSSSSATATATVVSVQSARAVSACTDVRIIEPTLLNGWLGVYPIPPELVGQPCVECAAGYNKAVVNPNVALPWVWVPADKLKPGQYNGCAKAGLKAGDRVGLSGDPGEAFAQVADAIGQIPAALGDVFRSTLTLAAILVLALLGLWLLVGAPPPLPPTLTAARMAAKLAK